MFVGVGRAGLVACCYLMWKGVVESAERAIQFVRLRRVRTLSPYLFLNLSRAYNDFKIMAIES
jgi:protein-tyrosine phosphatase